MNKTSRVLVIDDEAVIREGLRQTLELEGYQVELAANGQLGLDKLQKDAFDIVISDLKMPAMPGLRF